ELRFADRLADLEALLAALLFADGLVARNRALLVHGFADLLVLRRAAFLHHRFAHLPANGFLHLLVGGFVHRPVRGAFFSSVGGFGDGLHHLFGHVLVDGLRAFFDDRVVDNALAVRSLTGGEVGLGVATAVGAGILGAAEVPC